MSNTSWNPPTGPPNGAPVPQADARREIDQALDAARARDRELRAGVSALTTARVHMSARLADAIDEAAEATVLAKRALARSNESARAGQRADAARWTAAAQVFAMRLRDARGQVASLERESAVAAEQVQRAFTSLGENVGRLQAVVASRLPMLSGRKAKRVQQAVDQVVVEISTPTDDLVAGATEAARAAVEAGTADDEVVAVSDDDLESEVDLEGTDAILAELRTELGLAPPTAAEPSGSAEPHEHGVPAAPDQAPERSSGGPTSAPERTSGGNGKGKADGNATSTRSGAVPVVRR